MRLGETRSGASGQHHLSPDEPHRTGRPTTPSRPMRLRTYAPDPSMTTDEMYRRITELEARRNRGDQ